MTGVRWDKYPAVLPSNWAGRWLEMQGNLGLAPNTIDAYGRALDDYLRFCRTAGVDEATAGREHVARWVNDLCQRPRAAAGATQIGLANATIQQRLTAVRLFYDHLVFERVRDQNPVGRGTYTPTRGFGVPISQREHRVRGLVRRFEPLPWVPSDDEWRAVLKVVRSELLRNRTMFALSYDSALRREELCALEIRDLDVANRMLTVRAETTKSHRTRVVPFGPHSNSLYTAYLHHRRELSNKPGPLFLSESNRNRTSPVTIWTWSKVVESIAARAGVRRFSTHTNRHLCLTDLARSGWDIYRIATFAGHKDIRTTMKYIHLSGRELAGPLASGMAQIHAWRTALFEQQMEALPQPERRDAEPRSAAR
jgi:integrase/recombinase XerD